MLEVKTLTVTSQKMPNYGVLTAVTRVELHV